MYCNALPQQYILEFWFRPVHQTCTMRTLSNQDFYTQNLIHHNSYPHDRNSSFWFHHLGYDSQCHNKGRLVKWLLLELLLEKYRNPQIQQSSLDLEWVISSELTLEKLRVLPITATYSTESGYHWQHSRNLYSVNWLPITLSTFIALVYNATWWKK